MKLTVLERFTGLQILPQEGDFVTLKIMRKLKEALAMSEKELVEFEIKQEGNQVLWNKKGEEEREIKIGEKATDLIVDALTKLDKEKKLTENHFSLYEKFVK